MAIKVPELCLLELRFTVLGRIGKLSLFHGPKWSALIRELAKLHIPHTSLADTSIHIHPVDTGVVSYAKGDTIVVGMSLPGFRRPAVAAMLAELNDYTGGRGHFHPGKTIQLREIRCRILDQPVSVEEIETLATGLLDPETLEHEIAALASLESFTICFRAPLRIKNNESSGGNYCDPDFFLNNSDPSLPVRYLLARLQGGDTDPAKIQTLLQVSGGGLLFPDSPSGKHTTPYGGTLGNLHLSGKISPEEAQRLVLGQYIGLGKNRAHGLGFYVIHELEATAQVTPLLRPVTVLDRTIRIHRLERSLEKLQSAAPGPNGVTVQDFRLGGRPALVHLRTRVMSGEYRQGEIAIHRLKKKGKTSFRTITLQNTGDKLLQRAISDYLYPVIETLLSDCAWAYRKKRSRQGAARAVKKARAKGYNLGLQADIFSFFDSVDHDRLLSLLEGLYRKDPIVIHLKQWFRDLSANGISGLPQGSPLSPLLSNFYLVPFDQAMATDDCRLVRYGDDVVVLFKHESQREDITEKVQQELAMLGLSLNREKCRDITADEPVEFLGYRITAHTILPIKKHPVTSEPENDTWLPVFRENWYTGVPVYISSICRGAFSRGADLIIDHDNGKRMEIPWNRISHVIIVGRSSFSGGVIYRSMIEEIPVYFISVMGLATGHQYPTRYQRPRLTQAQETCFKDDGWCLATARSIIQAQILNRHVLLMRNNIREPRLKQMAQAASSAASLEQLRGYEGKAAHIYYTRFASLLDPFIFSTRVYHPPDNEINTMLSFGYTLLYNRIATALWNKGFDPVQGFFHKGRHNHFGLASDIMEDLRHIIERIVLSLVHNKVIKPSNFTPYIVRGQQSCRLDGHGFRQFIKRYEHTLTTPFSYKANKTMTANSYFDEAASSLARSIKLSIPYEPLRIR